MVLKSRANSDAPQALKLPLRLVLVVPFVLQIFTAVGIVGYLSFKNGQKAVNDLALRLSSEVSNRVEQHLDTYLATPHQINQLNAHAVEMGLLNPHNLKAAGQYIWKQAQIHQHLSYIGYALPNGNEAGAGRWVVGQGVVIDELIGKNDHIYSTNNRGDRTKLLSIDKYDLLKDTWYIATLKAGKPIWSRIYSLEGFKEYIAATASHPLYDQNRKLVAMLCVDLLLSDISQFLRQLKISPSSRVFVVGRDGMLIAHSSAQKPYKVVNGETKQISVLESSDPLIQALAKKLQQQFGNFKNIKQRQHLKYSLDGKQEFVQVTPWRDEYGLDWLVIVAVPESDFMAQINASTRTTILLCLLALGIATVLGIYTSRWITRPILRLSQASQAITAGNLDQTVAIQGVQEIEVLAQSFNQMAGQLSDSFTALEKINEELEQRVEQRTAELELAKDEAEVARVAADTANQAKSEFLASMSHELRTPLNGVMGYAQILLRDKTVSSQQKNGLNIIHQCGSHLLTLINDVLDISKIEAQKLELYPTDFHFENFLLGVREICGIRAEQKEIGFSYQILNHLPQAIHADEKRLRQVLINLLGNAIKFTDTGSVTFKVGLVTNSPAFFQSSDPELQIVDVSKENELTNCKTHKIRFQVEDTGIGIAPEQLEKIFLPFEQVGEFAYKEGTGLGLAISQKIVAMMDSEIKVESTYGKGSNFWFEIDLPEAINWTDSKQDKFDPNPISYQGEHRTILVVDDRWENRAVIVNLLTPIGFQLIEASNGQEGLDVARKLKPDLIITDLSMPVMNGLEMTQCFRESAEFKDIPIIASSASVFNFDRQQSIEAGCNDFLPKPVQASLLLEQLQDYLGLEWVYESKEKFTPEKSVTVSIQASNMVIPPSAELTTLYQAAKTGYASKIQEEANRLKQLNIEYANFATQILKLAEDFEDEAIVQLIQPYLL